MQKRDYLILAAAVCGALLLAVSQFFYQALPTGAWGLHFNREGAAPQGPASSQILSKYDGFKSSITFKSTVSNKSNGLSVIGGRNYHSLCVAGIRRHTVFVANELENNAFIRIIKADRAGQFVVICMFSGGDNYLVGSIVTS